jgi:flagellin
MIINHNIPALTTNNSLQKSNKLSQKYSEMLSTGKKINCAADNAAGLAIVNKMTAQINGVKMASQNTSDAVSLIQTADGGMEEVSSMLQRLRELAVEGATDTITDEDREKIQDEVNQLVQEIEDTSKKVQFNTKSLLDGSQNTLVFQVGPNSNLTMTVGMEKITALCDDDGNGLGLMGGSGMPGLTDSDGDEVSIEFTTAEVSYDKEGNPVSNEYISYLTRDNCSNAIVACDAAISAVSSFRSKLGAVQNRLEYTGNALETTNENTTEALSRIQDTDMASAMTEYTTANVLVQAGISMLTQANQLPNQLLSLLQ